jgi:hypothetical protein
MNLQIFNASQEQIHRMFSEFGEVILIKDDKYVTYTKFLELLKLPDLTFENNYSKTVFHFCSTSVGTVLKLPNTVLSENTKVVVLGSINLSVGLSDHEGMIFLVNSAFNLTISLRPIYQNIGQNKILFELSKALSAEENCYLPLSEFPSDTFLKKDKFERLFGIILNTICTDYQGRKHFDTNQEPIYISKRFYNKTGEEFICRPPGGELYITKLDMGLTL